MQCGVDQARSAPLTGLSVGIDETLSYGELLILGLQNIFG
jgi:hypothetical protein